MKTLEEYTDLYYQSIKDNELKLIASYEVGEALHRTFLVAKPNTMACSYYVASLPGGVLAVYGDYAPKHPGIISARGYGIGWFGDYLSSDYLAEKFLRQSFDSRLATLEAQDRLDGKWDSEVNKDTMSDDEIKFWTTIANWDYDDNTLEDLDDLAYECGMRNQFDDGYPGYGYNLTDHAQLCAVQRRFKELYKKLFQEPAKSIGEGE